MTPALCAIGQVAIFFNKEMPKGLVLSVLLGCSAYPATGEIAPH